MSILQSTGYGPAVELFLKIKTKFDIVTSKDAERTLANIKNNVFDEILDVTNKFFFFIDLIPAMKQTHDGEMLIS